MPGPQPTAFDDAAARWLTERVAAGEPLLLPTSGSTGRPKQVRLSAGAVRAAVGVSTTYAGAGHWLLALPLTHVAGWMVVARAALTGHGVAATDPDASFTAAAFLDAAARLPGGTWHTALVPTQLRRLLRDADATATLAGADTVLVGGASCPPSLVTSARDAGVRVVRTYGMTETCGGVVYDGHPLAGVRVRALRDGRLAIASPTLADGYDDEGATAEAFVTDGDVRWHITSDLGSVSDGVVQVLGRADDVIVTGGENVHPARVERALRDVPGVADCVVVGVPDEEWGQRVAALVEPEADHSVDGDELAEALRHVLPHHHVPSRWRVAPVPRMRLGKPDRRAAATQLGA